MTLTRPPCTAKSPAGEPCTCSADAIIEVGCENGHRKTVEACAAHALQLMLAGIGCWDCLAGPDRRDVQLLPAGFAEVIGEAG